MYRTGSGPYRIVKDDELRSIFYLKPQSGRAFMFSVSTVSPPGAGTPAVTELLRAMLYLRINSPRQRDALFQDIANKLPQRENIAIKAALLSRCNQALQTAWAYPALLDTATCRRIYAELKPFVEVSDTISNASSDPVSSIPIGAVLTKLLTAAGAFGYGLATYFGGKSKDYYDFYMRRVEIELASRGIIETSL